MTQSVSRKEVSVGAGAVRLPAFLAVPWDARGVVLFAHGSGSSRFSPRNRQVADSLNEDGFATVLLDLLSEDEHAQDRITRAFRFDIPLLAERLLHAIDHVRRDADSRKLPVGLFGASTGAAAALIARNRDVERFIGWLRGFNAELPPIAQRGMFGLDLYSLHRSAAAVIEYLDRVDPDGAKRARERYGCLDHGEAEGTGDGAQRYGYSVAMGITQSCEDDAVAQLSELLRSRAHLLEADGLAAEDEQFFAEINARVVRNAEEYYRGMFSSRVNTWNLRDMHMADTLFELHRHLSAQRGRDARIVVWAHNSHLGDARATQVSRYGELNLGQLVRERARAKSLLVGFTTYTGHVTAARDWDAPAEHRWVRPALKDSVERLFASSKLDRFFLPLNRMEKNALPDAFERAIGVIYRPETERQSHYFRVSLARQFDALFHLDETTALEPLDRDDHWNRKEARGEVPETWPSGI